MQLNLKKASAAAVHHLLTRCWTPKGRAQMRHHARLMRALHAGMFGPENAETGTRPLLDAGTLEVSGPEAFKELSDHLDKAIENAQFPGGMSIGVDELLDAMKAAQEPPAEAPAA